MFYLIQDSLHLFYGQSIRFGFFYLQTRDFLEWIVTNVFSILYGPLKGFTAYSKLGINRPSSPFFCPSILKFLDHPRGNIGHQFALKGFEKWFGMMLVSVPSLFVRVVFIPL